jgi:hypothetical protein
VPAIGFDIPEALSIGQLGESHGEILMIETTRLFYIPLSLVALHTTAEGMQWQVIGNLGKTS